MPFVACKLPAGLQIDAYGQVIILHGANIGEDIENVSKNGSPGDNPFRTHGYGLTELNPAQAEAFEKWSNDVTYVNGDKPAGKKLAAPFPALENGSILGPFKTIDDARKESATLASAVTTGFEGLDPEKEGTDSVKIEQDDDAGGKTAKK